MKGFSDDRKILQKPAFQCLNCLFVDRYRSLAVSLVGMSEENVSYLTSVHLFLTAFSSSFSAGLQRVTSRGPFSPSAALLLGLLTPACTSSLLPLGLWHFLNFKHPF